MLRMPSGSILLLTVLACGGGGDDSGGGTGQSDASSPDAASPPPASVAHCEFVPLPPTAGAGGVVEAGPLSAGAAEARLVLPISVALGGYTARAGIAGDAGRVDARVAELSGEFNPSIGVESAPRVKALALTTPGDTVVLVKADIIFSDDTLTADLADRLGPAYAGKVVFATTHSHAAPMQFSADGKLAVGGGVLRRQVREPLLDQLVEVAQAALDARRPARLGVLLERGFDPGDEVTRDRRGENDPLAGGSRDDDWLALIRVDGQDGLPIAVVPIFGMHGTVLDADNPLMSGDAPGAIDRALEETWDTPVVVMYLQGAAGDVSPAGRGGVAPPTAKGEPFYDFARAESVGRLAAPILRGAWERAGADMLDSLAIEAVTRSVVLGPDASRFAVRAGSLAYAPFDAERPCDREIYTPFDEVQSPIDEFNAPVGAALCGTVDADAIFPPGQIWNTEGLAPYRSCLRIDVASDLLGGLLDIDFGQAPLCASTRTTMSAIRLGDHAIATLPGEPLTLLADRVRELSPLGGERTIVVGYAQGHVGYLLTAEDWLQGGYEPSINSWGPLEGEYVAERAAEMLELLTTDAREDASEGTDRIASPAPEDADVPAPDPAPLAGTVPAALFEGLYVRNRAALAGAQPDATIPRVAGVARFVWIGEDPLAGTPRVILQRESAGVFEDVARQSGRLVEDGDLLLYWTPEPLARAPGETRTHHWVAEWQAVAVDGDLEDRAGLPLGTYRFQVTGTGYALASDPFDVVAGPVGVSASVAGRTVTITAGYAAPEGWRLLDQEGFSNQSVVVRRGPIAVVLEYASGPDDSFPAVKLGRPGRAEVAARAGATVTRVRVTDRFGNTGSAAPR